MKKLALFMLLSVSAPMFAIISDAQYEQEVQKLTDEIAKHHYATQMVRGASEQETAADIARRTGSDQALLEEFVRNENFPAVEYLIRVKGITPTNNVLRGAIEKRNTNLVKLLLDTGVFSSTDISNVTAVYGENPSPYFRDIVEFVKSQQRSKI